MAKENYKQNITFHFNDKTSVTYAFENTQNYLVYDTQNRYDKGADQLMPVRSFGLDFNNGVEGIIKGAFDKSAINGKSRELKDVVKIDNVDVYQMENACEEVARENVINAFISAIKTDEDSGEQHRLLGDHKKPGSDNILECLMCLNTEECELKPANVEGDMQLGGAEGEIVE